jgi:uncharacterized protein (TIGR02145 family)
MKTKNTFLSLVACFSISVNMLISQTSYGTLTDIDGNEYPTVQIGNQVWMAKNLRVTKTPNRTSVKAYAPQDIESKVETFGRLFPWEVAKKVCPS